MRRIKYEVNILDENGVWLGKTGDTIHCKNLTEAKKEVKKIVKNGGDARIYYEAECEQHDEGYCRGFIFYNAVKFCKEDLTDA